MMTTVVIDAFALRKRFLEGAYTPLNLFFPFDVIVEQLFTKENFEDHFITEEFASVITDLTVDSDNNKVVTDSEMEEEANIYNGCIDVSMKLLNDIETVISVSCPEEIMDIYPTDTTVKDDNVVLSYETQ